MKLKLTFLFFLISACCSAQLTTVTEQRNLSKKVSLVVKGERIGKVLQMIGRAGGFYFSYNGVLFRQDSLVNLNIKNTSVRDVLDQLFDGKVLYKENAEYIILRYAVNHLTIEAEHIANGDNEYSISGYVINTETGNKIANASVYEKKLLQAALTNNNGFFTLRFRGEHQGVILTASKETYRDTSLVFLADVNIRPKNYDDPDGEKGTFFSNTFGGRGIWRFLLSSKQRIQNLNIPDFLAQTPFQASFTPGLSSHGSMSSSVVNKASLNILGGYTAGTNGFEVAGAFNLTKGDIKKFQMAGLFNLVGGSVKGAQFAGAYNDVNLNFDGFQLSGLLNRTQGKVKGLQLSGAANLAKQDVEGAQIAGLFNSSKNTTGLQLGGVVNKTNETLKGVQISGIINYAKKMKGFQLGVVNLADSSSGVSIGLINLSSNGYKKISLFTNEIVNTNIAFTTGNANLYSILFAGKNFSDTAKTVTFGLGLGHDFNLNKRFSIGLQGTAQSLYQGNWENVDNLYKLQANLQFNALHRLTFFAGPAYAYYVKNNPADKKIALPSWQHNFSETTKGWLGWNVGATVSLEALQ